MGNWVVSVHVTGSHHNGKSRDVDQLAGKFVDQLKAEGHSVTSATIVSGGEQNLLHPSARFPLVDEG